MIRQSVTSRFHSVGIAGLAAFACEGLSATGAGQLSSEWTYTLPHEGDNDGIRSVLEIGDVDGDGVPDVLVGRQGMKSIAGRMPSEIFDARGTVVCVSGTNAAVHWALEGPTHLEKPNTFGSEIASLGDIDQDGIEDIALGMPYIPEGPTETDAWYPSTVLIVCGKSGRTIREHHGSKDRVDGFGMALAGLGDLDGDGTGDYAISACNARLYTSGASGRDKVMLYSGASGASIGAVDAARAGGAESVGGRLARLGDVDADTVPDFGVRIDAKRCFGGTWAVFSGKSLKPLFTIEAEGRLIGDELISLGDRTGDGLGDLAVLCVDRQGPEGGMFVGLISGKDGALMSRANLDGQSGCAMRYEAYRDFNGWRLLPTRSSKGLAEEVSVISLDPWCAYVVKPDWQAPQVMTMPTTSAIPNISCAAVSSVGYPRSGWFYCGFSESPERRSVRRVQL